MRLTKALSLLAVSLAAACGDDDPSGARANGALSVSEGEFPVESSDGGEPGDEPECPRGGETGRIYVEFECDEVVIVTCKDLSNVVLELADGSHVKYEGQQGHTNSFSDEQAIVGVWVKAGNNGSGDGPGYGERFDAPAGSCDEPGEPDGGSDPGDPPDAGDGTDPDLF